ncbi:unnamed protein product [Adineta steineri]|uniref:Uncharacterized protein n=1 Tax=Adineta steineri TaxID=433720 RepID=A0A815K298_9BILA|nr:unnamed protein product [Adineta steineri]CAF1562491.1 unnamed protein product [Adineta steineri]
MASWWHPQQQQQQQQTGEPFDYPHPPQSMAASPQCFYDSHMIMVEGGNNEEYMHTTNNGNINDSTSIDYHHHRRNWFNGSNNDDRKAKSRVAAKHRRSAENKEFTDLSKLLPLQQQIAAQLDKASIIRLTISYLRLHEFLLHGDPSWPNEINVPSRKQAFKLFNADESSQLLQSLDGFIFALSSDGRILYISESVSSSLGLSMVEMTGNFIFNYLHDDDKKVFADALGFELLPPSSPTTSLAIDLMNSSNNDPDLLDISPDQCPRMQAPTDGNRFKKKSLCVRMRSSLTKRAPNMKTPGYRSVQIIGDHRWLHPDHRRTSHNGDHLLGFVGTAIIPSLSPSQNEFPIPEHQSVIRLDENLHITYIDEKLQRTLNWTITHATTSLYLYIHPDDLPSLITAHRDLSSRQQLVLNVVRLQMNMVSPSPQYQRRINGNNNNNNNNQLIVEQKWIWCDLLATMMQSKTNDENFVILVVEIIGVDDGCIEPIINEELENEYANRITQRSQVSPTDIVESSPPTAQSRISVKQQQQQQQSPYPSEQQACFYPSPPPPPPLPPSSSFASSSPHHRHLPSTSTPSPSPSSPHSPLSTNRPSVIMTKGMHSHHPQQQQQQQYHPYPHYDCNTFTPQQYSLTTTPSEHWYYPSSSTNVGGENFPVYHHSHHHSS